MRTLAVCMSMRISFFPTSDDLSELSLEGQDFCWICNPNNPDGKLIHRTELLRLISANPQTTFIIDQAYVAFTTEDMLKPSDVKTHKNLILVQSISKAYNIPGCVSVIWSLLRRSRRK